MTAAVDPQQTLPLIECTSWCVDGDGHPNECCREDQSCWSPSSYVDLTLHPVHHEAGGDYPEQLGVMARRNHVQTVVYLHLQDIKIGAERVLDHSLHLTPDEAEKLAELLREGAKLVRSTPPPTR